MYGFVCGFVGSEMCMSDSLFSVGQFFWFSVLLFFRGSVFLVFCFLGLLRGLFSGCFFVLLGVSFFLLSSGWSVSLVLGSSGGSGFLAVAYSLLMLPTTDSA